MVAESTGCESKRKIAPRADPTNSLLKFSKMSLFNKLIVSFCDRMTLAPLAGRASSGPLFPRESGDSSALIRGIRCLLPVALMMLGTNYLYGQNFPNKPIRIVTTTSGGGADFTSRLIAQEILVPLG